MGLSPLESMAALAAVSEYWRDSARLGELGRIQRRVAQDGGDFTDWQFLVELAEDYAATGKLQELSNVGVLRQQVVRLFTERGGLGIPAAEIPAQPVQLHHPAVKVYDNIAPRFWAILCNEAHLDLFDPYLSNRGGGLVGVTTDNALSLAGRQRAEAAWITDINLNALRRLVLLKGFIGRYDCRAACVQALHQLITQRQYDPRILEALTREEQYLFGLAIADLRKIGTRILPRKLEGLWKNPFSWLGDDGSYAHLRGLVESGRLWLRSTSLWNHLLWEDIVGEAADLGVTIKTIYSSNIPLDSGHANLAPLMSVWISELFAHDARLLRTSAVTPEGEHLLDDAWHYHVADWEVFATLFASAMGAGRGDRLMKVMIQSLATKRQLGLSETAWSDLQRYVGDPSHRKQPLDYESAEASSGYLSRPVAFTDIPETTNLRDLTRAIRRLYPRLVLKIQDGRTSEGRLHRVLRAGSEDADLEIHILEYEHQGEVRYLVQPRVVQDARTSYGDEKIYRRSLMEGRASLTIIKDDLALRRGYRWNSTAGPRVISDLVSLKLHDGYEIHLDGAALADDEVISRARFVAIDEPRGIGYKFYATAQDKRLVLLPELFWAQVLEGIGLKDPGIEMVYERVLIENARPLMLLQHHAYAGYKMRTILREEDGWLFERRMRRTKGMDAHYVRMTSEGLERLWHGVFRVYAILLENGITQSDGVQCAVNLKTGEVVLYDYESFAVIDEELFQRRLAQGWKMATHLTADPTQFQRSLPELATYLNQLAEIARVKRPQAKPRVAGPTGSSPGQSVQPLLIQDGAEPSTSHPALIIRDGGTGVENGSDQGSANSPNRQHTPRQSSRPMMGSSTVGPRMRINLLWI